MNREQKTALVEELSEEIRSAEAIFAVDYRGISVSDAAELRRRLRDAQTRFRVVKNSLTERASDQAGAEALKAVLEGPTALAFVTGDAAVAAKALSDVGRALGTLQFKGGMMNGDALTAEQIQSIARLPAREVLHGQLVGMIAAPLTQLVRTLSALISGLAVQLQQVAEQGLLEADASPTSEAANADQGEPEAEPEATRAASDGDAAPAPEPAGEGEGEQSEAEAAETDEAPAETAEAPAAQELEPSEQPEPEPASDAEASEE